MMFVHFLTFVMDFFECIMDEDVEFVCAKKRIHRVVVMMIW